MGGGGHGKECGFKESGVVGVRERGVSEWVSGSGEGRRVGVRRGCCGGYMHGG